MNDSPTPERPEPDSAETQAKESAEPRPTGGPGGILADLEEGIGHLFAAMETGVINIAEAEGAKRRAKAAATDDAPVTDAATATTATDAPATTAAPASGTDDAPVTDAATATTAAADKAAPVAPRPSMTYEQALRPIDWRTVAWCGFALVALAAFYYLITLVQVWNGTGADQALPAEADAIVVLGAAQLDGTPSPALANRLDRAIELWQQDRANLVVTTGANQQGDRFTEGFSGFVYLRDNGIPEAEILVIVDGTNTYQQLAATKNQMNERELDHVLLVSDPYHSVRLRSIADELEMQVTVAPTDTSATFGNYAREAAGVSIGRLVGYRRLSAWSEPSQ